MEDPVAKIYTRKGDQGETSLLSGGKVPKDHDRLEAYGTLDELNTTLGLLCCEPLPKPALRQLDWIQSVLFSIGSHLADAKGVLEVPESVPWDVGRIEAWIEEMDLDLEPLQAFILPGGSRGAAVAHLARAVCRRAERHTAGLLAEDPDTVPDGVLAFINRLSDALFVFARWLNWNVGVKDREWRGGNG